MDTVTVRGDIFRGTHYGSVGVYTHAYGYTYAGAHEGGKAHGEGVLGKRGTPPRAVLKTKSKQLGIDAGKANPVHLRTAGGTPPPRCARSCGIFWGRVSVPQLGSGAGRRP